MNNLVQCQGCHGSGGYRDFTALDPNEPCGYCKGTGQTTRVMNCWIMRWAHNPGYIPSCNSERKHKRILERFNREQHQA